MPEPQAAIQIQRIDAETIEVPIVGTAPLISHRWSEKARRMMLDAQQGRKNPKEVRDPDEEYRQSLYRLPAGREDGAEYGFPVLGFKAATVGAARFFGKSVKMTELRQFMFMHGTLSADNRDMLVPIIGQPKMREDMVRIGMGSADLRYRGEFPDWSATLLVTYVKTALSRDSIISLIDAGGMGVGVGEWRPEKDGMNGTYAVDESRSVRVAEK